MSSCPRRRDWKELEEGRMGESKRSILGRCPFFLRGVPPTNSAYFKAQQRCPWLVIRLFLEGPLWLECGGCISDCLL
jgi:hypothetical protein